MTLFMVLAAAWGVLQLAALTWFTGRSTRLGTALLAIAVGAYGCGIAALLLQFLYTRGLAALTDSYIGEVVRTASYTVDPIIEEMVKVLPLVLIGLLLRQRFQWGLTDYVVLGAGLGAGFGLLEAVLRFSHLADQARSAGEGWLVQLGLSSTLIPDLGATLTSWLPAPATSDVLWVSGGPQTFMHLAWSATAGLGVGVLVRGRGAWRLLGVLPLVWVSAEHAAVNYDLGLATSTFGDMVAPSFMAAHGSLWVYPVIAVAIAGWFDLRDGARGRAALPELRLGGPLEPATLAGFAVRRLPWTGLIALHFVRARRALIYARARGDSTSFASYQKGVLEVRDRIERTNSAAAWRNTPGVREVLARLPSPRSLLRSWSVLVWLVLLVPTVVFFAIGGLPQTAFLQNALTSTVGGHLLVVVLVAALALLVWQLLTVLRGLRGAAQGPSIDPAVRSWFRLAGGLGAVVTGLVVLATVIGGTPMDHKAFTNFHVLDALAGAILAVLLLFAVAAVIAIFPPGGLALAGGGVAAMAGGISISGATIATTAVVGAVSGVMLAEAAGDSGSSGSSGRSGDSGRQSNTDKFPADDFEGTEYSADDLASMVHRHTGSGDLHIGGSAPRPTEAEILDVLKFGRSSGLDGQNAVKYIKDGIRVIINRDMPWRSTSYNMRG